MYEMITRNFCRPSLLLRHSSFVRLKKRSKQLPNHFNLVFLPLKKYTQSEMGNALKIKAAREYYYKREARRRAEREKKRLQCLEQVKELVAHYAPRFPEVQRVYLFGSLLKPGRFRSTSDIDLAVDCDSLEVESVFWRTLAYHLHRDLDIRPLSNPIIKETVANSGEQVYERDDTDSVKEHPA